MYGDRYRHVPVSFVVNKLAYHIPQSGFTKGIISSGTGITRIALNGIYDTIFYGFHNPYMIAGTICSPIKEDNISWNRRIVCVRPLSLLFKPCNSIRTKGEFRYNPCVNISALVGTPAYKAGTPLHPAAKPVP